MALFGKDIPPAVTPVTPAVEPAVTRDEFKALADSMKTLAESVQQAVSRPVVVQPAAAPAMAEPEITAEELDAAAAEGKGGEKIKALLARQAANLERRAQAEIDAVRQYGATAIGSLAEKTFVLGLNNDQKDVYERWGKEIKAAVAACEPALQGLAETWQSALEIVAGRHLPEIMDSRLEAVARQKAAADEAAAVMPGKGGRPAVPTDDEIPSFAQVAGASDFASDGTTAEEFIKKMNRGKPASQKYKDWDDYVQRGRAVERELAAMREGLMDGGDGRPPQ